MFHDYRRTGASLLLGAFRVGGCLPLEAPVASAPPEAAAPEADGWRNPSGGREDAVAEKPPVDPELVATYAARADGDRMLPAVDVTAFHRELLRKQVSYPTAEAPGTIVIDTKGPFLYLVEPEGMATRYGIAIGREGFGWTGAGTIRAPPAGRAGRRRRR